MKHDFSIYLDQHHADLVKCVKDKLDGRTVPEIDPKLIRAELDYSIDINEITDFLNELVINNVIYVEEHKYCSYEICENLISLDQLGHGKCNKCGSEFDDVGDPYIIKHFMTCASVNRDIRWMIVIHGFNTPGGWQEKISWLIANKLSYGAPVLIYKYGSERLGIFFRTRHNILMRRLGDDIRAAMEYSKSTGTMKAPDVVIHSFGSLLFSKLLTSNEFLDMKFGRIICIGSVINPNFDWEELIESNRIEAVLCHCGKQDFAVPFAQFAIPDAGPAGRVGFTSPSVININDNSFSHSSALEPENLDKQLRAGGLWDRFLTDPSGVFEDANKFKTQMWKPLWHPFQVVTRCIIIFVLIMFSIGIWSITSSLYFWLLNRVC